jgi:cytochrome b
VSVLGGDRFNNLNRHCWVGVALVDTLSVAIRVCGLGTSLARFLGFHRQLERQVLRES